MLQHVNHVVNALQAIAVAVAPVASVAASVDVMAHLVVTTVVVTAIVAPRRAAHAVMMQHSRHVVVQLTTRNNAVLNSMTKPTSGLAFFMPIIPRSGLSSGSSLISLFLAFEIRFIGV
jgi:hypothetical protein